MKTVIVTRMTVELPSEMYPGGDEENVYADMTAPYCFATMDEAKSDIEEAVRMEFTESDRYVVKDIVRVPRNGGWSVTVWYDGGRTEFHATAVELNREEYTP